MDWYTEGSFSNEINYRLDVIISALYNLFGRIFSTLINTLVLVVIVTPLAA